MKVIISYPPLKTDKGHPTLGQNRQFQYFKEPTYIYPVVPAQAATLLKSQGHEVLWNDCISEGMNWGDFLNFIIKNNPDLIAFETKTPVVKQHWSIIDQLKSIRPKIKCVLFGDHVTALPEESFNNSKVDFVLCGGDYDFLLANLCDNLENNRKEFEPGIWYRDKGQVKNSGEFKLNHDLDSLPFIDRDLTKWKTYAYKNGNYRRLPGTYIMSGRDCWWAKCTFCSWPTLYPSFRVRSVENVLDEIGKLISQYSVKEIMDDTGTFPVGEWLRNFCKGMIERGYNKKVSIDCNMRFGALTKEDYRLMKQAGFRLLLFGLESANQKTLDRINKNLTTEQITIMFGYPWEDYSDALNTLNLGKSLLKKGYAYTMQATIVIPYPGSRLFDECKRNGWLKTLDWDRYDMKEPIMSVNFSEEKLMNLVQEIYKIAFNPEFLLNRFTSIRDFHDLSYFFRAGFKVLGHIFDFSSKAKTS
ncbi:MAG TPA: radical SAM protein [Candidatus Omnitrophota bacterium]|nr:radical SAM protein [Candidatus Omnitrophota bacterium]